MYPVLISFVTGQIVGGIALALIQQHGKGLDTYYKSAMLLTGVAGLLTMLPLLYFYRKDRLCRIVGGLVKPSAAHGRIRDYLLLLVMGAAMAQFGNMLVSIVQVFLQSSTYEDTMTLVTEGKSLMEMIYWMGIVAPVAEETVFRWMVYARMRDYLKMPYAVVLSGLLFGIYHGNIVQFLYASLLGCLFAYFMEMTGSLYASVLLHIGANIWSLVYSEFGLWLLQSSAVGVLTVIDFLLLGAGRAGAKYGSRTGKERNIRCV